MTSDPSSPDQSSPDEGSYNRAVYDRAVHDRASSDLGLYLVLDQGLCGDRGVVATVAAAVRGGVSAVQVREPRASTRDLCRLAEAVHESLAGTGVPMFVNDRLDVALAVGAEGVHLGQTDLPADAARRAAGDRPLLIGVTVSSPADVAAVQAFPRGTVDYLGLSPVFRTATKPEAGPGLGLTGTQKLRSIAADLPCVAIGGITATNADQVRDTGVDGIAVVSAICAAADPEAAAKQLLPRAASRLRSRLVGTDSVGMGSGGSLSEGGRR